MSQLASPAVSTGPKKTLLFGSAALEVSWVSVFVRTCGLKAKIPPKDGLRPLFRCKPSSDDCQWAGTN